MNRIAKMGWCSSLILLVILAWIWQQFVRIFFQSGPAGFIGFFFLVGGVGFLISWLQGERVKGAKATRLRMAALCDELSGTIGNVSVPGLTLKGGEFVVAQLSQAGLLEYVSDGSTYQASTPALEWVSPRG